MSSMSFRAPSRVWEDELRFSCTSRLVGRRTRREMTQPAAGSFRPSFILKTTTENSWPLRSARKRSVEDRQELIRGVDASDGILPLK